MNDAQKVTQHTIETYLAALIRNLDDTFARRVTYRQHGREERVTVEFKNGYTKQFAANGMTDKQICLKVLSII